MKKKCPVSVRMKKRRRRPRRVAQYHEPTTPPARQSRVATQGAMNMSKTETNVAPDLRWLRNEEVDAVTGGELASSYVVKSIGEGLTKVASGGGGDTSAAAIYDLYDAIKPW